MMQEPEVAKVAQNVKCPVLILVCEKDTTVSPDSYKRVVEILDGKATVIKYPVGHFDIYRREFFIKAVDKQLNFLKRVLQE